MGDKKMKLNNLFKGKKGSNLLNTFIVIILAVGIFTGMAAFLGHNLKMAGNESMYVGQQDYDKSFGSLSEMEAHASKLEAMGKTAQANIQNISESSNIITAGLYLASGLVDIFKDSLGVMEIITGFIKGMLAPLQVAVTGINWIGGVIVSIFLIFVVFKVISAISGRTVI